MKKLVIGLVLACVTVLSHAAPGTDWSKFANCGLYACNSGIVAQFKVQDWWWNGVVDDEPVLPLTQGVQQRFHLWRPAVAISKVVQYATGATYTQGTDYILDNGDLVIPAGSTIHSAPAGFLTYVVQGTPYTSQSVKKDGSPLHLANDYSNYQLAVTYTTAPINLPEANALPKFSAKLAAHAPIAITYYGDSITAGANSSSFLAQAPNAPAYDGLLDAYMSTIAPGYIYWRNVAVAGWASDTGLQYVGSKVNDTQSDVVVLAFGMNDSAGNMSKANFKANMKGMIDSIRSVNPDTEFLLVSGITSNPDWVYNYPRFHGYRDVMHELAGVYPGVTVIDVTETWENMLTRKSYYDLTSNGVNHPGDFGHKIYVQTIIQALFGSEQ